MAGENRVPYIIDIEASFDKFKQQMKSGEAFNKGDIKAFNSFLTKALKSVNAEASQVGVNLQKGLKVDTSDLEKKLQLISGIFDEMGKAKNPISDWAEKGKSVYREFDNLQNSVATLAQNVVTMQTGLNNLTTAFKDFSDAYKSFDPTKFVGVSKTINDAEKSSDKIVNIMAKIETATSKTGGSQASLDKLVKKFNELKNIKLPDLSSLSLDKLEEEMDLLSEKWDELESKFTNKKSADYQLEKGKLLLQERNIAKAYAAKSNFPEATNAEIADIDAQLKRIHSMFEKAIEKLQQQLGSETFAQEISKQLSNIKINLSLDEKSKTNFINEINTFVKDVNKTPFEKVKIGISQTLDDSANIIENESKRAYGDRLADDDVNTTKLIAQTDKRFKGIRGVMYKNQNKILNATKTWRKDMLEQFKFNSGDFTFKLDNALVDELQALFDDYSLKVNIDPQYLADQIKTVLSDGGVSLGGGTANIDANSMAMAVATGLRAVLTGEIPQVPISGGTISDSNDIPEEVTHVATEIKQSAKHLDLAEDYVKDVVEKLYTLSKYAAKDTKGSVATKNLFDRLGIDLSKVKIAGDVGNNAEITSMIENSLLQRDEFGNLKGSTLPSELSSFKGSSSKTIPAFLTSMNEVFFMLQEDTQTVEEWTRKRHDREIFDSARGKANAASALRDIRSPIRQGDIPNIESIETAITLMSAIGQNTDNLQVLKTAREALADKTDDASIEEFKTAAKTFYDSSTKTFWDLKKQAENTFKGTVYVQGKNGKTSSKYIDSYKQIAGVKDDAVIVDVQVSSSLNNVALGTVKSKYSNRASQAEEKRLIRDAARPDFIIPREYEKDILNKKLKYRGFKTQNTASVPIDFDATIEGRKKTIVESENTIISLQENLALLEQEVKSKQAEVETLKKTLGLIGAEPTYQVHTTDEYGKRFDTLYSLNRNSKVTSEANLPKEGYNSKISEAINKKIALSDRLDKLSEQARLIENLTIEQAQTRLKSISERLVPDEEMALYQKFLNNPIDKDVLKKSLDIKGYSKEEIQKLRKLSIDDINGLLERGRTQRESIDLYSRFIQNPDDVKNDLVSSIQQITQESTSNQKKLDSYILTWAKSEEAKIPEAETMLKQAAEKVLSKIGSTMNSLYKDMIATEEKLKGNISDDEKTVLTAHMQDLFKTFAQAQEEYDNLVRQNKITRKRPLGADRLKNITSLQSQYSGSVRSELSGTVASTTAEIAELNSQKSRLRQQELEAASQREHSESLIQRAEAEKEYNKLLEKSLMLQGSIEKMTADEADEKALKRKQKELDKVNAKLDEAEIKVQALGGFLGQGNEKEYSDSERKRYALNELKLIEDDLITARAQKRISESRISKKDREIADLDKWGLGAGIGASELGKTKSRLTSEFMSGSYVQSQVKALREKTKAVIAESENESRAIFDKKVAMAMEHLNWNPLDQTQVDKFLKTKHGQQLSSDFASEVDTNTTNLWRQYDEYRKDLLTKLKTEFQNSFKTDKGVLTATSKVQDETGRWIDEIVEVRVKEALRVRLEEEKRILGVKNEPIQANIDRLEADKTAAIEYGGISDKELLSEDIIKDQIAKEERLSQLKEKRAEVQQKLNDLENAGIDHSDDSYKATKKDLNSFDKEIERYEMLIKNRQKLVQMRYDESKEPTYTDEEKKLHFTNQIVTYNQKIEDSLIKQKELTEQIKSATGDEKTKLQRKLSIEEENVAKWREKIPTYESKLNKLNTTKSKETTVGILPEGGIVGGIVSAVREVIGGVGAGVEINTEDLAKEATLRAILEVLGGVPNGNDGYGLGRDKKDLGHQEAKMIDAISRNPKRMAEIEAHIEEDLKKYNTRQDKQVADPKSYVDIQNLVKQYVAAYVGSLSASNLAESIDKSSDIELAIANKLQSVIGDKFNVDQLLEEVALGSKTQDKAVSEIAKVYGFKKSRQKKVETPIEPTIQPGAVAEEVKKNVAEIPAKADITPTTDDPKATYKSWNVKPKDLDFDTVKTKTVALKQVIDTLYDEGQSDTQEFINAQTELSKLLSSWRNKIGKTTNPELYGKTGKENWMSYLTSGDTKIFDNLDNVELSSISQADYLSRLKKIGVEPTVAKPEIKEAEATLQIKDFNEFKLQAQALKQAIEAQNTGSEEQKKIQTALVQVLQAWARSEASGFGGKLPSAEQWATYLTETGVFDKVNTSITPLTNRQLNKYTKSKDVVEKSVKQEKVEKKETKPAKKTETRTESRQSTTQQATGGLIQIVSRLATENTLLQVLSALQTLGTVEGGVTAPTAAGDLYNQFKALLLGGSIDDHERLAYMNSETGVISGNVIGNIANISDELIGALRAKYPTAQGFDTQVHTHGKATKPYFSIEDYNHFTKDYESGIKKQVLLTKDHISVLDLSAVKSAEEVQALMDELVKAGNNANAIKKVFENNKSGAMYESAKFDSLNANSLVKMLGANVNKPKDSNNAFESYISKIQEYKKVITNAQADGYLMDDDINVKRFTETSNEIDKLINSIANGVPVTDEMKTNFEQLYRNTIDYGNAINKTIGKNKNMYSGLSEINSVNKQRDKIIGVFGEDNFKSSDMQLIKQYNEAYEKLHQTYQGFAKDRTLYDTNNQEQLRQQAAGVEILGKKLMSSIQQADDLHKLVDQTGYYFNTRIGKDEKLGGVSNPLSAEEASVKNLENTMRHYVQDTLHQANIENVKFNSIKQQLIYTFRTSKDTVADMVVQYNAAENALFAYNKQERESLTGWPAFIQGMKSKIKSITQYMFSITSITRVWGEIRKGIQYIREIDSALTELKKVTDETEETYDRFLDTAAKTADKVGSTIKDVVSSTADWARLGYSIQEAAQMAESTQVLMNVSEFTDVSTATDSLISSIQAFKYTAEESMDVVDILNTIGNNYAISTADLATSLTKSSGSLVAANGTLEEAVALTATANTIIQDADVVGTALKTVAMRLRGTSTEEMEEEGLDTDGVVTSKSKLQSKIKGLSGVDILTDTGAYKSTYQILSEIANVWGDINDMDQAALLELLAGKRAGSVMSAILQNPETLKDAFESANTAAGSALAENEKYLDSIQGRIDLFNNAVQTMWSNALSDDVIKFFVNAGTFLVKAVDSLGLIKTLIIGIGTYLIKKHFNGDLFGGLFGARATQNINDIKTKLKSLKDDYEKAQNAFDNNHTVSNKIYRDKAKKKYEKYEGRVGSQIKEYDSLNEKLQTAQSNLNKYQTRLDNYQGKNQNTVKQYQAAVDKAKVEVNNLETELKQVEIQASATGNAGMSAGQKIKTGFKTATKSVWKFGKEVVKSMATMYAITSIMELLTKLGHFIEDWVDDWIETPEEAQEKFEEVKNELSGVKSELSDLNSELKTTQNRIDELMSQGNLSFTEQEELERLRTENDELERKIKLNETLKKTLQESANSQAVNATDKYVVGTSFMSDVSKSEKQEKGKEIGSSVLGIILGIVGAAVAGYFSGGSAAVVGYGAGSALGNWVGGLAGSAIAGTSYDSERTVSEEMDDMIATRAELKKVQDDALANNDTKAYNEATEALNTYDTQMAKHISQIQANYNAMDWETATKEERQSMIEYADWLDKYSIMHKTEGAKSNAIARIFGEEADEDLKNIKTKIEEAAKTGEDFKLRDILSEEEYQKVLNRLHSLGLGAGDVAAYFKSAYESEVEAMNDTSTENAVKEIANLTSGVKALKDAFNELRTEGKISIDTLMDLKDIFGSTQGWDEFITTVSTGTATIDQMTDKARELAENYINDKISPENWNPDEYLTYISYLESLGITNAKEFLDAKLQQAAVESFINGTYKTIEESVDAYSNDDHKVEISDEVIKTAENKKKAEDKAKKVQQNKNKYEQQKNDQENAKSNNERLKKEINQKKEDMKYAEESAEVYRQALSEPGLTSEEQIKLHNLHSEQSRIANQLKGEIKKLEGQIVDIPKITVPVTTKTDVDNANNNAKEAADVYQAELDKIGLVLDIQLIDVNDLIDDLQNAYDTLTDAAKEYAENGGYVSVDTLQTLLGLEPKYIGLLYNEQGQLNLNTYSIQRMTQARIMEMGILQAKSYLTDLENAAIANNTEQLTALTKATYLATDSEWGFVDAKLASIKAKMLDNGMSEVAAQQYIDNARHNIQSMQKLAETTAKNISNTISSSGNNIKDQASDAFQKAMTYWENRIGAEQSRFDQVQNEIDLLEKQGKIAGEEYYEEQISSEERRLGLLQQQKEEAKKYLGQFAEGSDEWWEVANTLNDLESEIDDVTLSIQDLRDAKAEVDWLIFEETHSRFDDLIGQLGTVRDLLSADEDTFFDDEGQWTETGVAVLGTHIQDIEIYKNALADVNEELKNLNIGDFDSEQEYYDKRQELIEQQHDYTKAISDSEQSVVDMYESQIDAIEEWADKATEAYQDYIDVVKEALDAERDLYEFKKDVQKQTKDIATLERRIASLSGSDNAADIAERRKLEAELYEAKEGLNDTYYDHAKDSQSQALDNEATAYEESMTKYIDTLREKLDEAKLNMDLFMEQVTTAVTTNAGTVLLKYQETGVQMSKELTQPWEDAAKKVAEFGGTDGALAAMNNWTKSGENGFVYNFSTNATTQLKSPWTEGSKAIDSFKGSVKTGMENVVSNIRTNVKTATDELNKIKTLYSEINDTTIKPPTGGGGGGGGGSFYDANVAALQEILNSAFGAKLTVDGIWGSKTSSALKTAQEKIKNFLGNCGYRDLLTVNGRFDAKTRQNMSTYFDLLIGQLRNEGNGSSMNGQVIQHWTTMKNKLPTAFHAKGTLGTTHDELAITDESWIGEEITLAAGKNGQLQYLKKGSAVMPADISANLIEWGKLNPDMMKVGTGTNVNMISNCISKPEFNISFDSLIKAENITEETLPAVKKLVTQELNRFTKELNYAIKGFAR